MAINEVARWWRVDPDVVAYGWACRDFLRRQEYMDIENYKMDLMSSNG